MSRDNIRMFGPMPPNHPSVGTDCVACHKPFIAGDYTTLIALGPADDPEEQEKCRDGRPYNAISVQIHWACATGEVIVNEQHPGQEPFIKPECELIGTDSNVFALSGLVKDALCEAGYSDKAKEFGARLPKCGSYDEALRLMLEYVDAY